MNRDNLIKKLTDRKFVAAEKTIDRTLCLAAARALCLPALRDMPKK